MATDDYTGDTNTSGVLTPGSSITGMLEAVSDHDWFRVTLNAQTTYQFTLASLLSGGWGNNLSATPTLGIYDPVSASYVSYAVQVGSAGQPVVWFEPTSSGVYYVDVYGDSIVSGYRLSAAALAVDDYAAGPTTAGRLAAGASAGGNIELGGDRDAFAVTLAAGVTYSFSASGAAAGNGTALPVLRLMGADGATLVAGDGSSSTLGYTSVAGGTFYLVVADADGVRGSGGYTVAMAQAADDFGASAANAGALAIGGSTSGSLQASGDIDWLRINVQAGQLYAFKLSGDNSIAVAIVDQSGQSMATYAIPQADGTSGLGWVAASSGTYYVQVSAAGSGAGGSYTVQAAAALTDDYAASSATSGRLLADSSISGRIDSPVDVDWIRVSLVAGNSYTFGLSTGKLADGGTASLAALQLVDALGNSLQTGTAVTATGEQVLSYRASASGDYYLQVGGDSSIAQASYTLSATTARSDAIPANSSTSATVAPGGSVKGTIDYAGDLDWYKVTLTAGANYSFAVSGAGGDGGTFNTDAGALQLRLVDASGNVIASDFGSSNGGAGFSYTAANAGTFYLQVGSEGVNTGTYTLRAGDDSHAIPDIRAPHLLSFSGPNLANGRGPAADLSFTFDETVLLGSGTIKISLASGALVQSFTLGNQIPVWVSGSQLWINPTNDLLPDTDYVIELGAGVVKDAAGNSNAQAISYQLHTAGANRVLTGTAGDDVFKLGTGNDTIDGGAGTDTLVLSGSRSDYSVTLTSLLTTVTSYTGTLATQTLTSVERLVFDDVGVAFDTRGAAGQVYRLYQAAFDREPDAGGMGYWLAQVDKGLSLHDVAVNFLGSGEFASLYGIAPGDAAFLTNVYQNVLHRAPDQGGYTYWMDQLAHGLARADLLNSFSESPENQLAVVGSIQNGITYTPYL